MVRRVGGGILLAVSVAAPVIVDKMDLHLSSVQGFWLLVGCGLLAIVGLVLAFWPEKQAASDRKSVTARASDGAIIDLEDSYSTADTMAYGEGGAKISAKRVVHDPSSSGPKGSRRGRPNDH
jgi:hypothetical protein